MRIAALRLLAVICILGLALGVALAQGPVVRATAATATVAAPALAPEPDAWHVEATLPGSVAGVTTFVWVVKTPGMADAYFLDKTAPFLIDPVRYGGKTVTVSARASGPASNPWGTSVKVNVPPAPVLTVDSDRWHVNATLPGVTSFVWVVKAPGMTDTYYPDLPAPFLIDPFKYGGKTVTVSARASGPASNAWAHQIQVAVPLPGSSPVLSLEDDGKHLDATLPGVTSFVWVVKAPGMTDTYYPDLPAPFLIDPFKYGGKTVTVSARASGPASNPWAPQFQVNVPPVKLFGIDNANGPQNTSGGDAKSLGITLDRIGFSYGDSISSMDAKVALDARNGLTPLPVLIQYGQVSQFDQAGWESWADMVVQRYGPGGTFWQGRTDAQYAPAYFELLNEPYGDWFYPEPEPSAYATFFANIVSSAKAANPNVKFLLAAYPGTFQDSNGARSSQSWDQLVKNSPDGPQALNLADGITVHPYGSYTGWGWHTAVLAHDDFPAQQVWITEIGYRIGSTMDGTTVDQSAQASLMQRSLADYMGWPWAQAYVWFKWADYGSGNMWGVVNDDGSHRPSYDTYQAFISSAPS